MKREFDAVVESDYSIIYFHYGLNSKVRGKVLDPNNTHPRVTGPLTPIPPYSRTSPT